MKYKKIIGWIATILTILVITVGTIWGFFVQLKGALTAETYRTLAEVSEDYNKSFSDHIEYNIKTLRVLSGSLEEMQGRTKQEVMEILQRAVDDGGFTKVVVCNSEGMSCSNDGISVDLSHREYFQKVMQGETEVSRPLTSVITGEDSIVIAVPIDDSRHETMGVLFGVYPLDSAGSELLDFSYYSEGYGFVIAQDGFIILSSEHMDKLADEKNIFSFFEKTNLMDISIEELKLAIKNGESKSFAFTYNDERRFVSFMPSEINDWYTLSISSDASMRKQEKTVNEIVLALVFKLLMAGALLLIWITMNNRRHNKELLRANQKYQSLLSNINGGMVVAVHAKSIDETIAIYVSSGFTQMTGYTLEDIQDIYQGKYLNVILEEDRGTAFDIYLEQVKVGNTYRMPYRIRTKSGSIIWVMDNGYLVEDTDGLHNHSVITDITVIKNQEEELRLSEKRFSVAINASSGTLFEVDLKRQLYTHFENAERIFGVPAEKLLADTRAFSSLPYNAFVDAVTNYFFHPDDRRLSKKAMDELLKDGTVSYEARLRRGDNSYIWSRIDLSLTPDEFGMPLFLVGFMSDIDDVKRQAEILANKVQTDPMTGLYNKVAMATLSDKILLDSPKGCHALIVLDIDNFKGINDTLGHAFGDVVLIEVSTKLKTLFRSDDIVGRMGGDEFAILMKNVPDTSGVLKKATELSAAFRQTYVGEKENYKISCSMGIIMIEDNTECFEALYRKADAALYKAKESGKDQSVLYQEKDADSYPIETRRTNDEDMHNLKEFHNIEAHIFELMYTSRDFNISINMAMAAIGQQYHVSRVAIFENNEENHTTSNIYEWCNDGITSEIENLQNLQMISGTESILDSFDQNGLLYCSDVRELPPYMRQILESQGILSNLQVTITNDEKIYGFIGFDECKEYRMWTSEEIEKLSYLAKILSVFLVKKKAEASVLENLNTRLKILDILPDYICVVNPATHVIEYANSKMQELFPAVRPGACCFTTLRGGQGAPCETCLLERIKRGDTNDLKIISEDKKSCLKVNAIAINWTKNQKMVLLYGATPYLTVI